MMRSSIVSTSFTWKRHKIQPFIRPQLQQMVDEKEISLTPAVELSYLKPEEQALVMEAIDSGQAVPTLTQAQQLKRASQEDGLDRAAVSSILSAGAPPSPTVRPPAQPKPPKPDKAEITGPGAGWRSPPGRPGRHRWCRCPPPGKGPGHTAPAGPPGCRRYPRRCSTAPRPW